MLKIKHVAAYPAEYLELFSAPGKGSKDTLREFLNAIERMTGPKGIPFRSEDDRLKFKGDALEVLAELFFTRFNSDPRMGLTNYTPISVAEDYGVDAMGNNANGDLTMVQVKYRGNPQDVVTYAEIARTFTAGVLMHGLDPTKDHTVFVFTTANEVSRQCSKVLQDKLVVINRAYIKKVIDSNKNFWNLCLQDVQEYISYHNLTGSFII